MRSVELDSPSIRVVCFQSVVRNERWQLAYELAIAERVCPSFRPPHPNWAENVLGRSCKRNL